MGQFCAVSTHRLKANVMALDGITSRELTWLDEVMMGVCVCLCVLGAACESNRAYVALLGRGRVAPQGSAQPQGRGCMETQTDKEEWPYQKWEPTGL